MTSGIGIDGLISGLNTTEVIDKLIAAEGNQRTLLSSKKSSLQSLATALQSLNVKVASLATASAAALKPDSWQATSATSSAKSVTATTTTGAQPSTVTMTVDALAASQSTLYTLPADYTDTKPSFTLTLGGEATTITALSTNIGDIVAAFNAEGSGVTATAVNVGTPAAPSYKLQLTGTQSGAANTFGVTAGNAAGGSALTSQELRAAADAQITLWPGSAGATTVKSASNTFQGVLTGVSLTVSEKTPADETVTVTTSSATASDGSALVTGGLFSGNSTIRGLQQTLLAAGSAEIGGQSSASVGIVLGKDGTFTFDSAAFASAYAADPAGVQKVVQDIAGRLETAATTASDATEGTLTAQITANKSEVDDLTDRIAGWDDRLASRRAALVKTYAAMEVAMSKMQSTSNFLTQQLAQLNANNAS
jgi:flagellar hook-associated protein 2